MKVRMKSTHESAPDGIHVGKFEKGKTYDLPEVAAKRFIAKGWATATKTAIEPEETKVVEPEETPEEPKEKAENERHKK